jgi:hypothetical protein
MILCVHQCSIALVSIININLIEKGERANLAVTYSGFVLIDQDIYFFDH